MEVVSIASFVLPELIKTIAVIVLLPEHYELKYCNNSIAIKCMICNYRINKIYKLILVHFCNINIYYMSKIKNRSFKGQKVRLWENVIACRRTLKNAYLKNAYLKANA